jgi:RNA polymerase sigma factor (sigma-70 family)
MAWLTENRERLLRFRAGEAGVQGEVYSIYAPALARTLGEGLVITVDARTYRFNGFAAAFDLDDVVQETFIRAFSESARNAYDGIRPFRTWLLAIAKNLLIDRFRQAKRTTSLFTMLEPETAEGSSSPAVSPENNAIDAQLRRTYSEFMATLDERSRTLIRLRFEESETRRAVTEATGLSAMQVRSRESQLRKKLFDLFKTLGYGSAVLLCAFWGL